MNNLARELGPAEPALCYGEVLEEGERLQVALESGRVAARLARSCLLRPRAGDRVLLTLDPRGEAFILAVLERPEGRGDDLELQGPASLRTCGSLCLQASGDLGLEAAGTLTGSAPRVELDAVSLDVRADRASLLARLLESHAERVSAFAASVDQVFGSLLQRLGKSHRYVTEEDRLQAGSLSRMVEGEATLHAARVHTMAEERITLHSEQIHLS